VGHNEVENAKTLNQQGFDLRPLLPGFVASIQAHLLKIYPNIASEDAAQFDRICSRVAEVCQRHLQTCEPAHQDSRWNEKDIALICYGDQVSDGATPTLEVLKDFLCQHKIDELLNIVHLLPINPYTSDDGFSVVNYRAVDSKLGDWNNVRSLGQRFDLMLDLVLNHVSQQSDYFQKFLAGHAPFDQFFIVADPAKDYSSVTRPRNLPLLSEKESVAGPVSIWTTFSADQVDLNFASPEVLIEMLDVLLLYVRNGGRIIRLDAIAYLWKQLGTSCIHLPQTHEVVKLMRTCFDAVSSPSLLLTETNVPHAENISYFGDADEAHMVYQFSLPPLLLDAFFSGDARTISSWLETVCHPAAGTTFFNFTASHDGIGVRPLEGIVSPARVQALADAALAGGGKVGLKTNSDGTTSPYELNVTYVDMLLTDSDSDTPGIERFISSQAVMLAMKGIPGIYFHSLFGTRNDIDGVNQSGIARRINRRKFTLTEINRRLEVETSVQRRILEKYKTLLSIRIEQPAFHPDAQQSVYQISNQSILGFQRSCDHSGQRITILTNFSPQPQTVSISELDAPEIQCDLISGAALETITCDGRIELPAFGCLWLLHEQR
jgi:sucrose phosphorylase